MTFQLIISLQIIIILEGDVLTFASLIPSFRAFPAPALWSTAITRTRPSFYAFCWMRLNESSWEQSSATAAQLCEPHGCCNLIAHSSLCHSQRYESLCFYSSPHAASAPHAIFYKNQHIYVIFTPPLSPPPFHSCALHISVPPFPRRCLPCSPCS